MGVKHQRKNQRQTICGRGFCHCQNKRYVHGKGIMDIFNSLKNIATPAINAVKDNQDAIKSGAEAIQNFVKIGDSNRTIVQEIMKKRKTKEVATADNLQNIIDKINQFKVGSGFA